MTKYLFTLLLIEAISCSADFTRTPFYKGVNLVGTSQVQKSDIYDDLINVKVNSVSIVPFAYGNSNSGELTIKTDWQWWGESIEGSKELAKMAKEKGMKVMLKPQIWFDGGRYTGNVNLESEEKWKRFESSYEEYILLHAKSASDLELDIFCIGTELKEFVLNRPTFWKELIFKVKAIYKGKLTYAGNWDSYKLIPFWEELDYIGVDAYFPLSDSDTPTVEEVKDGWSGPIAELKEISETNNKKILFCEFGFRSISKCAMKPWVSDRGGELNLIAQRNCYQGTFESVWTEPFMAGGFLWKWYPDHEKYGGPSCKRFTPQNKPSQKIISDFFSRK